MDFNYAVAHRDMTSLIAKVAKILGPRGLLPNQKLGTVTADVGKVVTELKKGLAFFKNDKNGIVHFAIGKVSFDVDFLHQNLQSFVKELLAVRPATVKGKFIKKITISSTMGIGIRVNADELLQA
jgi:large subunit ribosomal protein L1